MTQRIHGGDAVQVAAKLGFPRGDMIDFSANINPLGPSEKALKKIKEYAGEIIHYPDPECSELREVLKNTYPVKDDNIIFGNGASELVFILMNVLRPRSVLIPAPTFIEYQFAAQSVGSQVHFLNLNIEDNFSFPMEVFKKTAGAHDVLFLCNPNNPTGTLLEKAWVKEIIKIACEQNIFMVLDEAFMDFLEQEEQYSFVFQENTPDNIFILRSMTKFFAIPGLRLGWGKGSADIIEKMHLSKDPWNVNILAQAAGKESLLDESYIENTRRYINEEKQFLYHELAQIKGLKPYFPSVNYIFVELTDRGLTSESLRESLSRRGVLIRDCSNYTNLDSRYIRIAVRQRDENRRIVESLRELLGD